MKLSELKTDLEFTENNRELLSTYSQIIQGNTGKVKIKLYFKSLAGEMNCLIEVNGKLKTFDTTTEAIAFLDGIYTILN